MKFIDKSKKHLRDSKCSYVEHMLFAEKAGVELILVGIASMIHGVFPFLYTSTSAKKVIKLFYERIYNHPNPVYKKYMKLMKKEYSK
jgi:hypothetical protein